MEQLINKGKNKSQGNSNKNLSSFTDVIKFIPHFSQITTQNLPNYQKKFDFKGISWAEPSRVEA